MPWERTWHVWLPICAAEPRFRVCADTPSSFLLSGLCFYAENYFRIVNNRAIALIGCANANVGDLRRSKAHRVQNCGAGRGCVRIATGLHHLCLYFQVFLGTLRNDSRHIRWEWIVACAALRVSSLRLQNNDLPVGIDIDDVEDVRPTKNVKVGIVVNRPFRFKDLVELLQRGLFTQFLAQFDEVCPFLSSSGSRQDATDCLHLAPDIPFVIRAPWRDWRTTGRWCRARQ